MAVLQFLAGTDFVNKTLNFQPGTIYLDTATGEMWFDDPRGIAKDHAKIVDLDTLIYEIEEWVEFPSGVDSGGSEGGSEGGSGSDDNDSGSTSSTTARLGYAILGVMKLGDET